MILVSSLTVTCVVCFLFVSRPLAQVEARRSVTAGLGPVTTVRPVRGHGRSRLVTPSHVAAGWVTVVTAPGRRPGPLPLSASDSLARLSDRSAIASIGTSCHVRLSRSPLPGYGPRRCLRDLAATLRSRLRSKMYQGQNGPAAGHLLPRRHRRQDRALAAARRLLFRPRPLRARGGHRSPPRPLRPEPDIY